MRLSTFITSLGFSLLAAATCGPPSPPSPPTNPTINQPWTVTEFTVSGPPDWQEAAFRVTAPDNYVTGVQGLDVVCEEVPYGLDTDTECGSDNSFRLSASISYQESYPRVRFKLNHTQIDATTITIVTGQDYVLPAEAFEFAVETVVIRL